MDQAFNSILTYLERLPLEDRVRMAQDIETMTHTRGWDVFTDLLGKALEEQRGTVEFKVHEHVEYASMTGRLRGFKYAQQIVPAILESGERANNQLQQIAEEEIPA